MGWPYAAEPPLEPPEPNIDGVWVCEDCEEVIPGDCIAFEVDGKYYCETCMDERRHYAPFKADYDPRNEYDPSED